MMAAHRDQHLADKQAKDARWPNMYDDLNPLPEDQEDNKDDAEEGEGGDPAKKKKKKSKFNFKSHSFIHKFVF